MTFGRQGMTKTATERQIKSAANNNKSLNGMMSTLGYSGSHPGGNTMTRFKRVLGNDVYSELASRKRFKLARSRWTKVSMNRR